VLLLADTSAWHRAPHPSIAPLWQEHLAAHRIATTEIIRLEVLYSAQSPLDYDHVAAELEALRSVPCTQEALQRALSTQRQLAHLRPLHHRVAITDLIIAAVAELSDATVWHYDADFERIAGVTGQAVEWIAERGSL